MTPANGMNQSASVNIEAKTSSLNESLTSDWLCIVSCTLLSRDWFTLAQDSCREYPALKKATGTHHPLIMTSLGLLLASLVVARSPTGLRFQPDVGYHHRFVYRLAHIVDRERGDGGCGERFHLDPSLAVGTGCGNDCDPVSAQIELHVCVIERKGMAQRDQL